MSKVHRDFKRQEVTTDKFQLLFTRTTYDTYAIKVYVRSNHGQGLTFVGHLDEGTSFTTINTAWEHWRKIVAYRLPVVEQMINGLQPA